MGISRIWAPENGSDTSGTPGYMAPEVMCRQNHGIAVDYYAVGIILYELMLGKRPYSGKDRKDIREFVISKQLEIPKEDVPNDWSYDAMDFVNKCIQRKPSNRLGSSNPDEVKNHPWLQDVDWSKMLAMELDAPFLPKPKLAVQKKQLNTEEEERFQKELEEQDILLRRNSI